MLFALLGLWLLFGLIAALIYSSRGSSGCIGFIVGALLGPIGVVIALFEGEKCPHCQSRINADAKVCPKCRRETRPVRRPSGDQPEERDNRKVWKPGKW